MKKGMIAAGLAVAAAAVIYISLAKERKESHADPVTLSCEGGMLLVEAAEYPADVVLFHVGAGGSAPGMAYRLTGPSLLPPASGDGEYIACVRDGDGSAATSACAVLGTDEASVFLKPTASMARCFPLLKADLGEDATLGSITELFAGSFSYSAEPNEGEHAPYMPDVWHTRELRRGSCADLAALYAAYLRSAGIPAKVVYGDRTMPGGKPEAHAWAEACEDGEWVIVDISSLCSGKDPRDGYAPGERYGDRYCIY